MQVIDRLENLANGLRRILLRELAVIANSIEQLSTSSQLCHNVEFVLDSSEPAISGKPPRANTPWTQTSRQRRRCEDVEASEAS